MDTVIFVILIIAALFLIMEAFRITAQRIIFGWLGLALTVIALILTRL